MNQQPTVSPTSFAVTCPGCGQRLRFSVAADAPARLRLQCSSCKGTFGVRRPGAGPAETSTGSIGVTPPTYVGMPTAPPAAGFATASPAASARRRAADEPAFSPGDLIADRYRVIRFIARGGMGEVYEVEDLELRERVALKTVRPEVARDATTVERFKREIQLARKVTHPNVCRIFDVSHHREGGPGSLAEGIIFLTMELLPGETLAQRLHRSGPLGTEEALPIVRQIAEALHAAHQAGVIHRDLKPGNVMLVESRGAVRAVVTDFGLARLEAAEGAGPALTLTAAAAVVGTPAYLAPEQVEGAEITPAVDIYALGIVLYEMLTGTVPFLGDTVLSTAVKRLQEAPVSPRVHAPGLDPRWERAVLRCLERVPVARFTTAPDLLRVLAGPPEPAPRPAAPETVVLPAKSPGRKRPLQTAGLAALILLSFAVAFYRYYQWKEEQTAPARQLRVPVASVTPRRSIAVLGFKDRSGGAGGTAWLSPALAEMLSTELGAGGGLRVVAGETVARAKVEAGLGEAGGLARDTLSRLRSLLGSDAVVLGSYVVVGGPEDRQIRLDLRLQDTATGSTSTIAETGREDELFDLVSRLGKRLRRELGTEEISEAEPGSARAALPSTPEAARLYAEGVSRLRLFDPVGARDLLARAAAAEPGNALIHSGLAAAWAALGYDGRAREEAKAAFDLAGNLPREERLLIEGRYREATQDWGRAVETYWKLWSLFPDSLDHGLRLAAAQTAAGQAEDALASADALRTLPPPLREDPRIDLAEATAAGARADFKRQQTAAARAATRGAALGAPLLVAQARVLECRALRNLGQAGGALAACEEGRKLHAEAGDRAGAAEALTHAANVHYDRGDLPTALRLYEEALATHREIGNRGAEAGALNNIAVVLKSQGDLGRAQSLYQEVLAVTREIGSRSGEAYALNNLAGVLLRRGELQKAGRLFEESLAIRREQQDRSGEAYALDNLGVALRKRGDLAGARGRHEEALRIRRETGQKIGEVSSLNNLGAVLLDQGELAAARKSFEASFALCRETGSKSASASALFGLGEVLAREGRLAEARKRHEAALDLRTRLGEKGMAAESRLALAALKLEEGDAAGAGELARAAAVELGRQGSVDDEALALALSAETARARGDTAGAREAIARATSRLEGNENLRARLTVELHAARLKRPGEAEAALRAVAGEAARAGLLELRLRADLALGEMEAARGEAGGRERLAAVGQEARALGYGLLARKTGAGAP
ncbi:MAG TPA: tetratricopeptide repeat-containing serine/threonine-protein kinase [Thermoanaerobaculia bacterium]|nr:tetratricopeptide repeat-containing serine/threonine-protein kinase [Thermoanaerobaculia bacterium]